MVRTLLIALLIASAAFRPAAFAAAPAAAGKPARCLSCHPPHRVPEGGCTGCHRGDDRAGRKAIAHAGMLPKSWSGFRDPADPYVARGKSVVDRSGCRRCHLAGGKGTRLAAELDAAIGGAPSRIREAILRPALHMPDFRFSPGDADAVAAALLALAESAGRGKRRQAPPRVVLFADGDSAPDPFTKHCGGCHRAVSPRYGGVGSGNAGPNLTALFTEFHPGRASGGARWTPALLARWAENPRSVRPVALMPPVRVPAQEFPPLVESLRVAP
jgi:hypothetical protein